MKKPFIIFLFCLSVVSCKRKNAWTPEYEKSVYDQTYAGVGTIVKDSAQRKDLALRMVAEYKRRLPYGLNSISTDSLMKLSQQIGIEIGNTDFGEKLNAKIAWSNEVVQSVRVSLMQNLGKVQVPPSSKNAFCDCAIHELKTIYPDSLSSPLSDSVTDKIDNDCKQYLGQK